MRRSSLITTILIVATLAASSCNAVGTSEPTPTAELSHESEILGFQDEELERQNTELEAWANQLADGYGPGVWYFNPDGSRYPLYHHAPADPSLEGITAELNQMLSEGVAPQVILDGVAGSTVKVGLSDDAALTQRMGSAGAQAYLQVVLYSLTSIPGIDCIDFDFIEGDHAQPGLYCR
jgi:hypothetical protein